MEQWRAIAGFPGYEVSDLGNVRSWKPDGGFAPVPMKPRLMVLRACKRTGYLRVGLRRDLKRHWFLVHRLVLEAFVGPCPPGKECAHLNGVRADERLSNLEWKTKLENDADKDIHGTRPLGSRHAQAKLTEEQVAAILVDTDSNTAIALKFGVDRTMVGLIKRGKNWKHVPRPAAGGNGAA